MDEMSIKYEKTSLIDLLSKAVIVFFLLGIGAIIGAFLAIQLIIHIVSFDVPQQRYESSQPQPLQYNNPNSN